MRELTRVLPRALYLICGIIAGLAIWGLFKLLVGTAADAGLFASALAATGTAASLIRTNSPVARRFDKHFSSARDRRLMAFALFATGGVMLFAKIAEDVALHETSQFDRAFSLWVHGFDTPALDSIMIWLSFIGSFPAVVVYVAAIVLIWSWRRDDDAAMIGLLGVIAIDEALNRILKDIFDRPRPTLFEEIATLHSYSFPSGHAMSATAIYGMMAVVVGRMVPRLKKWAYAAAVVLALLIGLSRIYLGVHWLTDVLAGYAAGAAILFLGILWLEIKPADRTIRRPPAARMSSE